jgi:hypothetical protein
LLFLKVTRLFASLIAVVSVFAVAAWLLATQPSIHASESVIEGSIENVTIDDSSGDDASRVSTVNFTVAGWLQEALWPWAAGSVAVSSCLLATALHVAVERVEHFGSGVLRQPFAMW